MTRRINKGLLAAICFLVATTTACSGDKAPEGPVEIHYLVTFPVSFADDPLAKRYTDAIEDFNLLHPEYKAVVDYLPPIEGAASVNLISEIMKLLESKDTPDVAPWFLLDKGERKGAGLLRDLRDLMKDDADIPENILEAGTQDGELLVLPFGASPSGIFYNKELFDAASIPYPAGEWTWQQYREISGKMKGNGSLLTYDVRTLRSLLSGTGNDVFSPDGKTSVGYLDSPETVRMLQWLNAWYRDENQSSPLTIYDIFGQFDGRKRGMIAGGLGDRFSSFEGEGKRELGVAPEPYFEGGQRTNQIYLSGYGISRESEHPEAAWELIRYLALEVNEHSLRLAEDYIPTSRTLAEAAKVKEDPIKSVFYEELNFAAASPSFPIYFFEAWNGSLENDFSRLLAADDEEIQSKLHELAQSLDAEMSRLSNAAHSQAETEK